MSGPDVGYAATLVLCDVMRCPVLIQRMLLRACYAMSGTDIGYAVTRRRRKSPRGRICFTLRS
eukprot:387208-Rhodomonas_salina.2